MRDQTITYTYDQLNRLMQKTYPDSTAVNYTYDNDSRLTAVTDPTGTYSFTFDNMGRLTGTSTSYSFLTSRSFTTSYGYDKASNRTGFTDPENGSTTSAYDTLNRLQTLTPPSAFTSGSFGFSYDALSRRTQMTRPNSITTNYTYDNLSRLLSVLHQSGTTTLDGATYTLDNAGNRTAKTDQRTAVATSYGYDSIYQLLSATQGATTTESYTYDPVGNRLSDLTTSGWSNNTSNELTSRPGVSYTFDNNGNTLTSVTGSNTTTYAWDFENRLTSVTLPGSGGIVSFSYDPFGRRIKKSSSAGTSIFAYDGDNLIEETNSSGAAVARYTQGENIDEPLAMLRSSTTSYCQADGIGSVTSLSNSAGALAQTYTFDSFGRTTASSGSLVNPFQYTGRELDSETSLYYMRARYFDPATGRFLSEDPSKYLSEWNLYAYAGSDPVEFVDPWGLQKGSKGTPGDISKLASNRGGSTDWAVAKAKGIFKPGDDKCNVFVADTISDAGAGQSVPLRHILFGGPPAAEDWANPNIQSLGCWKIVNGPPKPGDVIAAHTGGTAHPHWAHVGIFVGTGTASANTAPGISPPGLITINQWGLRPGENPVVRRCQCCGTQGGGKK